MLVATLRDREKKKKKKKKKKKNGCRFDGVGKRVEDNLVRVFDSRW